MIGTILGFFTGSWRWLLVLALVSSVLYLQGRMDGYASRTDEIDKTRDLEMADMIDQLTAAQNKANKIVASVTERKTEVRRNVDKIERPTASPCDLGPSWLRAYNDGVRAAASAGDPAH